MSDKSDCMGESELTNAIIQEERSDKDNLKHEFEPESHYNYYGDRGVVDLRFDEHVFSQISEDTGVWKHDWTQLIEVKSESAIENCTGANSILQQFNKMREYYLRDDSNSAAKNVKY